MTNLQTEVKDICRLANAVVKNPSDSLSTTAKKIGVCDAVAGFATRGTMTFSDLIIMSTITCIFIWLGKELFRDEEKERQEKERMLREVTRKQQAVINKLNEELARSRQQNAQNRQERSPPCLRKTQPPPKTKPVFWKRTG